MLRTPELKPFIVYVRPPPFDVLKETRHQVDITVIKCSWGKAENMRIYWLPFCLLINLITIVINMSLHASFSCTCPFSWALLIWSTQRSLLVICTCTIIIIMIIIGVCSVNLWWDKFSLLYRRWVPGYDPGDLIRWWNIKRHDNMIRYHQIWSYIIERHDNMIRYDQIWSDIIG